MQGLPFALHIWVHNKHVAKRDEVMYSRQLSANLAVDFEVRSRGSTI
jgi:hypothetical protein